MSAITYATIPATNDDDGWVVECQQITATATDHITYRHVGLGNQLRVYMTRQERDAIVNDGNWHHTSRACRGCDYRVWNANLADRSDQGVQLGLDLGVGS